MRGTSCPIALFFVLFGAEVSAAQHASKADFEAWAAAIEGRLVGEVMEGDEQP